MPTNAPSDWHNAITNKPLTAEGRLFLGGILCKFPVAILIGGA